MSERSKRNFASVPTVIEPPPPLQCVWESRLKLRPGTTTTLTEDVHIPCGNYVFVVEDDDKKGTLLTSHKASGEVLILSEKGNVEMYKMKYNFQKEYPLHKEIEFPPWTYKGGASDIREDAQTVRIIWNLESHAHIKKIRLQAKLLSQVEHQTQVLSSQTTEQKKGHHKNSSASSLSQTQSQSTNLLPLDHVNMLELQRSSSTTANKRISEDEGKKCEKQSFDLVEKDIIYVHKNITYNSKGEEQNNTTQVHMEHSKITSKSAEGLEKTEKIEKMDITTTTTTDKKEKEIIDKSDKIDEKTENTEKIDKTDEFNMSCTTQSESTVDPTEENLVYYKEVKLKKKIVTKEQVPIQQKGRYYLVIESADTLIDKNRHFSCHLSISNSDGRIVKESFTNDAKRKITDDFRVDSDSAILTLEMANMNYTFGLITELQISLYKNHVVEQKPDTEVHPRFRTGELVWSVHSCEVEKKKPQKFSVTIPMSGRYYFVVEKVDKIYGGLREVCVSATLTEPSQKEGTPSHTSHLASAVVGGVKIRPMKWKSPVFIAPACSVVDFTVESYAIVGSIIYSLRLRKIPGITAEEERTRHMVLLFLTIFGIYYFIYVILSILHFIQNIGFTFSFLLISVDITLGRLCCILFALWFRTNQQIIIPILHDIVATTQKIARKIKYLRQMSDGGKFDILRIFKQMAKEGKENDMRKWEMQKIQTANE